MHRVDAGVAEVRGQPQLDLDRLPAHPPDDLGDLADEGVEIDDAGLVLLPAAEFEDLARDRRGLETGAVDFLQVLGRGRHVGDLRAEDLAVAVDDREQVVEIVRHPARQQTDRPELLRLEQGLALTPELSAVVINHHQRPGGPGEGPVFPTREEFRAVLAIEPGLAGAIACDLGGCPSLAQCRHIGPRAVEEAGVFAPQLRGGVAGQGAKFGVGQVDGGTAVLPAVRRENGRVGESGEQGLACRQLAGLAGHGQGASRSTTHSPPGSRR